MAGGERTVESDGTAIKRIRPKDTRCELLGFNTTWLQAPNLSTHMLAMEINRRPQLAVMADVSKRNVVFFIFSVQF